jgi:hypothetical protein
MAGRVYILVMNTNAATQTTSRDPFQVGTIEPRTAYLIPTGSWATGQTCHAITQTGNDCTREATHQAVATGPRKSASTALCTTHATSKYVVDANL